jgi:DNA-binding NarL/FixJ family response regulator
VVLDHGLVDGVGELATVRRTAAASRVFPALTDREFEVLELIAQGCNNSEIARKLVVNPKTVRNHITNIFAKLHLADRSSAIVLAHKNGVGA